MSTAFALTNPDYANQRAVPDFADYFARATSLENQTGATGSGLVGPAAQR